MKCFLAAWSSGFQSQHSESQVWWYMTINYTLKRWEDTGFKVMFSYQSWWSAYITTDGILKGWVANEMVQWLKHWLLFQRSQHPLGR